MSTPEHMYTRITTTSMIWNRGNLSYLKVYGCYLFNTQIYENGVLHSTLLNNKILVVQ